MKVIFDVKHLYYLPQYLPVHQELIKRNIECSFLFYKQNDSNLDDTCQAIINDEALNSTWVRNSDDALEFYIKQQADWIIFGNAVDRIDEIHQASKTVLMQHGIGPKSCYYDVSNNQTTVRFVEGQHRLRRLQELFPKGNFVDTGYAKLDPAFNNHTSMIDLNSLGLDATKKTLLYAPTFYPSSIEMFSKNFPTEFSDYNIILKPHFFSITKQKYAKQHQLLKHWEQQENVYLAPVASYNLLPFMAISDVLISDASSAIFEFAALDKPVVWCDFYKLRWSYRGIFSFRFKARLDSDINFFHQIADRVANYKQLNSIIKNVIANPVDKSKQRLQLTEELAGLTDGQCSVRICTYLENN